MLQDKKFEEQLNDYTNKLLLVKEEFIKLQKEKLVSIRKDVVASELKDILIQSNDYESLKTNLSRYIESLLTITKDGENNNEENENNN